MRVTQESAFEGEERPQRKICKRRDRVLAFGVGDRAPPEEECPEPTERPENPEDRHDYARHQPRSDEQVEDHLSRIPSQMTCVVVERRPQTRIRRYSEEDAAAGCDQPRRLIQQTRVVLDMLDDVEESNEIETPGKRRSASFCEHHRQCSLARETKITHPPLKANCPPMPRQRLEEIAVPATEFENTGAKPASQALSCKANDARAAMGKPEVMVPQWPEDFVAPFRVPGLERGVATHRR